MKIIILVFFLANGEREVFPYTFSTMDQCIATAKEKEYYAWACFEDASLSVPEVRI